MASELLKNGDPNTSIGPHTFVELGMPMVSHEDGGGIVAHNEAMDIDQIGGQESNTGLDEGDCQPLPNLSTDIRGELEKALSSPMDFNGSFYFHRSYAEAPNPLLRLDGLEHIGLPLSSREAKALISQCTQAPFGKGERTIVDTSVRDTWEMDASKVRFDNPAWQTFMDSTVQEVCAALGVNTTASQPRCELYKLLVYETGSHFLPHQDTEKEKGMFATVVVVLPSPFTGGAAHLSHSGLSTVLDCSTGSLGQTSVLAWYTDVTHEIKPMTSGYRLALSFNLIHTTDALRPATTLSHGAVANLRNILLSWKEKLDFTPLKIIFNLEHQYAQASLRGSALKGTDAHKVALLDILARQHGFQLALATVELYVKGEGSDLGHYGGATKASAVSIAHEKGSRVKIKSMVDLDGLKLCDSTDCDDEIEMIPLSLRASLRQGRPDKEQYEGYQGNWAGTKEEWYRRTVLLIWPEVHGVQITNQLDETCESLSLAASRLPSQLDQHRIESLLAGVSLSRILATDVVAQCVCKVAGGWDDIQLWRRAFVTCKAAQAVDILGEDGILSSILDFGLEIVQPEIESILVNEPSNSRRFGLLAALQEGLKGHKEERVASWLTERRKVLTESLKVPKDDEIPLLAKLALEPNGISSLQMTILPQVKVLANVDFLRTFALHIHDQLIPLIRDSSDKASAHLVIKELLSSAIEKVKFYERNARGPIFRRSRPVTLSAFMRTPIGLPSTKLAHIYLGASLKTGNEDVASAILDKLITPTGLCPEVRLERATAVLLPLIPLLFDDLRTRPISAPSIAGLDEYYQTTIDWFLTQTDERSPTKEHWLALVQVLILAQGTELLEKTVLPKFKALPWNENCSAELITQLHAHRADLSGSAGLHSDLLSELVRDNAERMVFTYIRTILKALDLCFDTGNAHISSLVLSRALAQELLGANYITTVLVPLIPELSKFANKHNLTIMDDPFAPACRSIVVAWINKILGQRPADISAYIAAVSKNTCECDHCIDVVEFLVSSPEREFTLSRIGVSRKHVESQLITFSGRAAATWKTIQTLPQGLQITKSDALFKAQNWASEQAKGNAILETISTNEAVRRSVLGDQYDTVIELLTDRNVAGPNYADIPPTSTSNAPVSPQQGSSTLKRKRSNTGDMDVTDPTNGP